MNGPSNRILIVENESAALASVRNLLRQEGYAVAAAQNAVQASDILKQQQLAVVLADQQTPVLTGVEFLAEVKRIQPDTSRVLMASSLTMSAAIQAINRVEVYRLVHKPWHREDLIVAVRDAVDRYETLVRDKLLLMTTKAMNDTLTKLNQSLEMNLAEARQQNPCKR